jgi:ornithine cyclodeaminase/alanine dehydrogenase-like protein (mu-crystallin family)
LKYPSYEHVLEGDIMTVLIRESDVANILTMDLAINWVEESLRQQSAGVVSSPPRMEVSMPSRTFRVVAASIPSMGFVGVKSFIPLVGGVVLSLYDTNSGQLVGLVGADKIGQYRTGATSAVATKYLARRDAEEVGIIGSGRQARTQLRGICAVRKVDAAKVYSPNEAHRESFCNEMSRELGIHVSAIDNAEETVKSADVVVTATTSSTPVLRGAWLRQGVHVNAIGAVTPTKQEIDIDVVTRSNIVAVDSKEQARIVSGDLLVAEKSRALSWENVVQLGDIIAGKQLGRTTDSENTLFKPHGLASGDVALAAGVFGLARERGIGIEVDFT